MNNASSGDNKNNYSGQGQLPLDAPDQLQRPPNLTLELAQLLAATIAQRQGSQLSPVASPTGSELVTLAALGSVGPEHRMLAPANREGLSSLTYRPQPQHNMLEPMELPDDEPMPIPSTWRQPAAHDEDRWLRQQLGAAALGLVAGLVIVIPTVLWLSGWISGSKAKSVTQVAAAPIEAKSSDIRTVKVQVRPLERPTETAASYVTGSIEPRLPLEQRVPVTSEPPQVADEPLKEPEPTPPPSEARSVELQQAALTPAAKPVETAPPVPRGDDILQQAKQRVEQGDIAGAREILTAAESTIPGAAWFGLAETYDPNMLAAWGTRGIASDVARARALYQKSLDFGMGRARARLDALN